MSSTPRWTRSGVMPTPSEMSSRTRSRSSTRSTSSSSAQVVDEVRRRVQQHTVGHRVHKDDPQHKIRGLLRHAHDHLTHPGRPRGWTPDSRPVTPTWEVTIARRCYQKLRAIYHAPSPAAGHRLAEQVIKTFPTCPIPEVARLGRTLRAWRPQVLAYFATDGVSNGGTEAINLLIDKTRRLSHGFRNFSHYRLRILLVAAGDRPYRRAPAHA